MTDSRVKPKLLRFSDWTIEELNVEYHVHTKQTDGQNTVGEILTAASKEGIRSLAFTEHVRRETDWFVKFVNEVREVADLFPEITVFVGCEAKALDFEGALDVSQRILAEADIVLGSVHRIPDGKGGCYDLGTMPAADLVEAEYRLALGLLRNAPIDVLAHPGGMSQRFHGGFPTSHFRDLVIESIKTEVAIEISSSYLRDPQAFLDLCVELDPRVSIGSDVHEVRAIGTCGEMLRGYLRRAGRRG